MQMVWHEAVRENCKLEFLGGTHKLLMNGFDCRMADKVMSSFKRAEGQEIPLWARVGVPSKTTWTHAGRKASMLPAPLKGALRGDRRP